MKHCSRLPLRPPPAPTVYSTAGGLGAGGFGSGGFGSGGFGSGGFTPGGLGAGESARVAA